MSQPIRNKNRHPSASGFKDGEDKDNGLPVKRQDNKGRSTAISLPKNIKPKGKPKPTSKAKKTGLDRFKSEDGKYGTSKLEDKFAKKFLDKLGIKYVRQFKMGGTGRYCDFAVLDHNILIEVDGDYFHAYGILVEDMDKIQKKNHAVDLKKDRWALENGFIMVRVWEHDIIKHPAKVMRRLKDLFGISDYNKKNKLKPKK